jgi:hypothetical protein
MSFQMLNLRDEAYAEAARLSAARVFMRSRDDSIAGRFEPAGALVARARRRETRRRLDGRLLLVFRVNSEDEAGRSFETHLVAALCPPSGFAAADRPRERVRRAIRTVQHVAGGRVQHASVNWGRAALASAAAFTSSRLDRERAIVERIRTTATRRPYQTGLFDRRADRAHAEEDDAAADCERQILARLELLEQSIARTITSHLVLVLTP